ncbi:hypothetical protein BUALT_Bualt09G0103200 [Buddleja alternifolia]|uniref:Pre-rRNA-processing protein Ipi1 N-terminal domain-containing protein n=1 Tax=Buddleja alternifolia TaxID=168488 RepID=A0AAV6X8S3_9LAMI|nr:hypothetical protein BUALT_Bualt09G0103200 [Buddleja alternifolia]
MVKNKSQSKKSQKRGVDFKKIKRKIGRKLPPPKNATNTEIKSKAIVLPEQSIAAEKAGLAVSRKGLTLKELLQQTSHHNAKVRKDALLGVKDILLKNPVELKLHKLAIIEKLRERIGDDDKFVRETLYQLFKTVIFPGCAQDNQGPLVSLMMAYTFHAMTHLAIEVRLMAFKFFDLIVQFFPSSFSLYAEKILQKYEDILRKNHFLHDKSKLKSILTGLIRCLSLLPCNEKEEENEFPEREVLHAYTEVKKPIDLAGTITLKDLLPVLVGIFQDFMALMRTASQLDAQSCDSMQYILQSIDLIVRFLVSSEGYSQIRPSRWEFDMIACDHIISPMTLKKLWGVFPLNLVYHLSGKDDDRIFMLNTLIAKIFLQLSYWSHCPSNLLEKFMEFIESSLSTKIQSGKVFHEKPLLPLIPYIPKLTMQISNDWRSRVLQAFTELFRNCNPESSMKLACVSAIKEMFDPESGWIDLDANDPILLDYVVAWIQDLPPLLILLDDKNPLCSKAVVRLLLRVGQVAPVRASILWEFENTQYSFRGFFGMKNGEAICYGPFIKLTPDIQQLALHCVYYYSVMDSLLLESLVLCCLYNDLEPDMVFRILEVLNCASRAGHIPIADYASFHVTLLSRFQVYPEKIPIVEYDRKSNRRTFKRVTKDVCSYLSQLGDHDLVFRMLEKIIVDQICGEIPMDNKCAFLRLIVTLDPKVTSISDESVVNISRVLPQYLIDIIYNVEEDDHDSAIAVKRRLYYLIPSFYLIHGCNRLLNVVLKEMGSWVYDVSSLLGSHSVDKICAIASLLLDMYKDTKIRKILSSCKIEIETVFQSVFNLLSSEGTKLTLEEKHKIQSAYDRLRATMERTPSTE